MGNMDVAVAFIVLANLLMWFSQIAMLDVNPAGSVCYHVDGSIIGNSIASSNSSNTNILTQLPESQVTNNAGGSGGFVTDLFNNILGWFKSVPGLNYIINIASAPSNLLSCIGAPQEFTTGIGVLWYLLSTLVVLSYLWWR